jgi:hypothetical protein
LYIGMSKPLKGLAQMVIKVPVRECGYQTMPPWTLGGASTLTVTQHKDAQHCPS